MPEELLVRSVTLGDSPRKALISESARPPMDVTNEALASSFAIWRPCGGWIFPNQSIWFGRSPLVRLVLSTNKFKLWDSFSFLYFIIWRNLYILYIPKHYRQHSHLRLNECWIHRNERRHSFHAKRFYASIGPLHVIILRAIRTRSLRTIMRQ